MLTLKSHYDKSKNPTVSDYRELTLDEAKKLRYGDHVQFVTRHGTVANAKVNGSPKTWKNRPGDCRVPLKYGMYEFFYADWRNGESTGETLVTLA